MRRIAAALLVALLAVPATASAQWGYVWAGGGMVMPTGDAADVMESGMMGTAGIGWTVPSMRAWSFQAEGIYGSHSAKVGSGSTKMTTVMANVSYDINAASSNHPYIYGGIGSTSSKASYGGSSSSDMAGQVSGGYSWKVNDKMNFWAEVRYLSSGDGAGKYTAMPIAVGFGWPLGKKK